MNYNDNKKVKIGIITMPHEAKIKEGNSHIMKSYVDWLQQFNIEVIVIPYNTSDHEYYFRHIHGLLFQGGETEYVLQNKTYMSCCKIFFDLAINANNNGEYFPIWGVCFGFEVLLSLVGNINKFSEYYDHGYKPLIITKKNSRLFSWFNKSYLYYLENADSTLQNHEFGISPSEFRGNKNLVKFYNICSSCIDEYGKEYVSSIEAKKYPFYGIIWHPERQKTSYFFSEFLYSELCKNNKSMVHNSTIKIINGNTDKHYNCKQYAELKHMRCYFF
jgi:gamma-glutamyl hydrolase